MPIYDYRCNDCEKVFERLVLNSGDEKGECTQCGSTNVTRVFSSSYSIRATRPTVGKTCCGRDQQCETPGCSTGEACRRR